MLVQCVPHTTTAGVSSWEWSLDRARAAVSNAREILHLGAPQAPIDAVMELADAVDLLAEAVAKLEDAKFPD